MCAGHKKYAVDCRNAAGEREMGPLCGSLPRYAGALAGLQRISIHCKHQRRPPGRLRTAWLKTVTVHGDFQALRAHANWSNRYHGSEPTTLWRLSAASGIRQS